MNKFIEGFSNILLLYNSIFFLWKYFKKIFSKAVSNIKIFFFLGFLYINLQ